MSDYPESLICKAADAIERELMSGRYYDTHMESEEALARVALDAVAEQLGQHVAAKILAFMDARHPLAGPRADPLSPWRRHLRAAARIAAFAFLAEDDKLRMAATALAAGNYVACPAPEDSDDV